MNLAIIIPYYKLTFFRETLKSLATQTDKRFHVYIGNDASPENPEKLLKEFEGRFLFTYKRFDKNLGGTSLTKQWERCLEMVQDEEWFMILGDDDYLGLDAVRGFNETIENIDNTIRVLRFDFELINEKRNLHHEAVRYTDNETSADFIVKRARGKVRTSLSEYVFNKESLLKYGIRTYPKAFYSDNMMVLNCSDFGIIKNILKGYVVIRISDLSITGNQSNKDDLLLAGYYFYYDLLNEYRDRFRKDQREFFLHIVFDGYVDNRFDIGFFQLYKLIYRNFGLKKVIYFFQLQIKRSLYKALHPNDN